LLSGNTNERDARTTDAIGNGLQLRARYGQNVRVNAMGRRNLLFSGSEGGTESWGILASLVNTAKLHEFDPQAYLAMCWSASSPVGPRATGCTNFSPVTGRATREFSARAAA
jgi:hypothetical protein